MNNLQKSEDEIKISNRFDLDTAEEIEAQGFRWTAKLHVDTIREFDSKSAVDVGSGPGVVPIELANVGISKVYGIDLSKDMLAMAAENIEKRGLNGQIELFHGSFLDFTVPQIDGISLHRVICCYYDRQAMVEKAISLDPKVICITVPRNHVGIWTLIGIKAWIRGLLGKFRPYIHSQKSIDKQLKEANYKVHERKQDWFWKTSIYAKLS